MYQVKKSRFTQLGKGEKGKDRGNPWQRAHMKTSVQSMQQQGKALKVVDTILR